MCAHRKPKCALTPAIAPSAPAPAAPTRRARSDSIANGTASMTAGKRVADAAAARRNAGISHRRCTASIAPSTAASVRDSLYGIENMIPAGATARSTVARRAMASSNTVAVSFPSRRTAASASARERTIPPTVWSMPTVPRPAKTIGHPGMNAKLVCTPVFASVG